MCVGCADFAYVFFSLQSEKIPYFSLSFALSVYERRTLGAPVWLIYIFRFKAKKIPYFTLSFCLLPFVPFKRIWAAHPRCADLAYIFFRFKAKKIPYFALSFALGEYEQSTHGAPVSLKYFCGFKPKENPLFFRLVHPLFPVPRRFSDNMQRRKKGYNSFTCIFSICE